MGDWSEWSDCSANCSLGETNGEKTRQRSLRKGPLQDPEIQVQPCSKQCPAGGTKLIKSKGKTFVPQTVQNLRSTFAKYPEVRCTR